MNLFASFLFPAFFISHNKIMHIKDIEFLSTRKYINMRRTTHCVLLSHHLSLAHCHSNVCVYPQQAIIRFACNTLIPNCTRYTYY